jgi:hypothetical protein
LAVITVRIERRVAELSEVSRAVPASLTRRGRTGLAGCSELREHFGQASIVLSGYPAGDDVVYQLIVREYLQEELAEVGR